jgi:transcriptional regulator with XRE-family HTH domain
VQRFSGAKLRKAREAAGLRREHIAVATERSADSVVSWELGRARPSMDALTRLAACLDVAVGDLFDDEQVSA